VMVLLDLYHISAIGGSPEGILPSCESSTIALISACFSRLCRTSETSVPLFLP
jgi:hypothetical protein